MRNRLFAFVALLGLSLAPVMAQKAAVTVLHGVPGLPQAVDVYANNNKLFSFDFGGVQGPLMLDPGTYSLEVRLGTTTILGPANATVAADMNYSVIAHLTDAGKPTLSIYKNDISALKKDTSRLVVRHNAEAPAVDVRLKRWWWTVATFRNLANPGEAQGDVWRGTYYASLYPAGKWQRAFGPVKLTLEADKVYIAYAVGTLGKSSFRLLLQVIDLGGAPTKLKAMPMGKSCGGAIGVSTTTPEFGKEFKVNLTGAAANAFGVMHIGSSDSRFLFLRLPFALDILGAPGCYLSTSINTIRVFKTDGQGMASQAFTIPASMAGTFDGVYFQFGYDNGGKNRLGLSFTDYLAVERN